METQEQKIIYSLDFIKKSISELMNTGCHKEYIKIIMPKYFKDCITIYNRQTLSANFRFKTFSLYGCQIFNHYNNEIVVYNEMWDPLKANTAKFLKL